MGTGPLLDFEIQRCTRECAGTGRALEPGESFFSVLAREGAEIVRRDYCAAAWEGPPPDAIGWWQSQMPSPNSQRAAWAPNQVLIHYFADLVAHGEQPELCYVLALLLVRRKLLRIQPSPAPPDLPASSQPDSSQPDSSQSRPPATMHVHCPLNDEEYDVPIAAPPRARFAELEEELGRLLFAQET